MTPATASKTTADGRQALICPVLAADPDQLEQLQAAASKTEVGLHPCGSFDEWCKVLDGESGPALMASQALSAAAWQKLASILRSQPDWSDLPLLIIGKPDTEADDVDFVLDQANTTLLLPPFDDYDVAGFLRVGMESRRRQFQVRDLLNELQTTNTHLDRRVNQLQRLVLTLSQAEDYERRRVAQDLHDGVQQLLAAARITVRQLEAEDREPRARKESLRLMKQILQEAIEASRSLTRSLSPPVLDHAGLGPALAQLGEQTSDEHDLNVAVAFDKAGRDLDPKIRGFLYAAARELLLNVQRHADGDQVSIQLSRDAQQVTLDVHDDGVGFDPARLDYHSEDEPVGMGLFGLRERTEILGGEFDLHSIPGDGTRVRLSLPLAITLATEATATATAAEPAAVEPSANGRKIRLMVADDHQVMRNGLISILSDLDEIEVVGEANDGEEALATARELQPDVIIMDISMPKMNGVEVTRILKIEQPTTHVIGLSMLEEPQVADEMLDAGADEFLVKSGPAERLIGAVLAAGQRAKTDV